MNKLLTRTLVGAGCLTIALTGTLSLTPKAAYAATTQTTDSQKADKIISLSKSLEGKVHYIFGENNPSRFIFDCSSFTKYVFESQGISLKWDSEIQSTQGTFVNKRNLLKGDLVFFSVGTPGQVNHVGIYTGDGKFIHNTVSNSFNGVKISNLSDYNDRYITARRVIN
ncbi:NlpC/P60 family protein [Paenibacillus sp. LMG 31456]|uniref:NlpC/P60 family protein n=1 Tax=Paenibacillus foliorum TaxID=2654974 RepID=A0A972GVN6_9BACL|nr:C40 family peptidase [Paenibacillus foliorum]NOU95324.1 NlpC/P60 family protein [Paenibacillus foliorum]